MTIRGKNVYGILAVSLLVSSCSLGGGDVPPNSSPTPSPLAPSSGAVPSGAPSSVPATGSTQTGIVPGATQTPSSTERTTSTSSPSVTARRPSTSATSARTTAKPKPTATKKSAAQMWAELSPAKQREYISRYNALSPAEKQRVRKLACARYGVGC